MTAGAEVTAGGSACSPAAPAPRSLSTVLAPAPLWAGCAQLRCRVTSGLPRGRCGGHPQMNKGGCSLVYVLPKRALGVCVS